tara:strand:+ start:226 stop:600 length:375 start_codon:yes stop_codon:yes gene_type:complete
MKLNKNYYIFALLFLLFILYLPFVLSPSRKFITPQYLEDNPNERHYFKFSGIENEFLLSDFYDNKGDVAFNKEEKTIIVKLNTNDKKEINLIRKVFNQYKSVPHGDLKDVDVRFFGKGETWNEL